MDNKEFLARVKKEMFELYFDNKISNEDFYGAEKFLKILEKKYKSLNKSNKKLSRQIMKTAVKTLPEDKPKTRKIVINTKYGGFGLSHKAMMRYAELKGIKLYPYIDDICKEVYGKDATLDNPDTIIHYATKPVTGENKEKELNKYFFSDYDIHRDDPILVRVVEELGEEANGAHARLKIVEIPYDVDWQIEEYDGNEWVSEKHRVWD